MSTLTETQQKVMGFIRDFRRERGKSPTAREIQHFLGIKSPNGATCHIKALVKKGVLRVDGCYQARSLIPVDEKDPRDELIAELLAACKALQMEAAARGCGLRIADEAIAKAEGRLDSAGAAR